MAAHAKYSASGSKRWIECPGSIRLEASARPESTKRLRKGRRRISFRNDNESGFVLDESSTRKSTASRWSITLTKRTNMSLTTRQKGGFRREKIDTSSCTTKGQFGTVDATIAEPFGTLEVVDYKYGAGIVVEPEDNTQLLLYAIGAAHEFDYNFEDVKLTIIQPRAPHALGPIRSWTTSIENLKKWATVFRQAVIACEEPDAPLKAGDHCRFCRAASTCPEITDKAFQSAQIVFDDWGDHESGITGTLQLPVVKDGMRELSKKLEAALLRYGYRESALLFLRRRKNSGLNLSRNVRLENGETPIT